MAKRKAGLHKNISSIFDGVNIPDQSNHTALPGPERTAAPENTTAPETTTAPKKTAATENPTRPETHAVPEKAAPPKLQTMSIPETPITHPYNQESGVPAKNYSPPPAFSKLEKPKIQPSKLNKTPAATKLKVIVEQNNYQQPGQKKMAFLVMVLALVFIVVFGRNFLPEKNAPKRTQATPVAVAANVSPVPAVETIEISWTKPDLFPELYRDPMMVMKPPPKIEPPPKPLIPKPEPVKLEPITIQGIVFGDIPIVIINNRMVREGEKIAGRTVIKIFRDSVELEMNGKRWNQQVQEYQK